MTNSPHFIHIFPYTSFYFCVASKSSLPRRIKFYHMIIFLHTRLSSTSPHSNPSQPVQISFFLFALSQHSRLDPPICVYRFDILLEHTVYTLRSTNCVHFFPPVVQPDNIRRALVFARFESASILRVARKRHTLRRCGNRRSPRR
jgi:hypothetical protein